jgi:hypothetical protein
MQLIYCHDGRLCRLRRRYRPLPARRGRISVALDANGRMKELVGFRERAPQILQGSAVPRLADLSDTELVIYGP